jgi:cell shape-determining protein MreD
MRVSFIDAAAVALIVIIQFLLEVTLGRFLFAPNLLVPMLVYLSMNRDGGWGIQGAFFTGLCLDLLTHQPPGTSSLSMILGILAAQSLLSTTTAAGAVSFYSHAAIASVVSDILFILLASRPPGLFFGQRVLLVFPRVLLPLLCLAVLQTAIVHARSRTA